MTIRSILGKTPRIAATAWVSEAAYVVGDVEIGEGSSVWPGAVIRGDFAPIVIGSNTHIEDNCVVHTGEPLSIGDNCIVGHGAVVHCRTIGSNCLVGNKATILDGTVVGHECLVAAGALVLGRLEVPDRSFVSGSPAEIEPIDDRRLARLRHQSPNPEAGYGLMTRVYREAGL